MVATTRSNRDYDAGSAMAVGAGRARTQAPRYPVANPPILPYRPMEPSSISLAGPEERLLASDKASAAVASGATGTEIPMYASENGVIDLNRLYAGMAPSAAAADEDAAFTQLVTGGRMSTMLVRGSEKLVFAGEAPLSAYSTNFGYQAWRQTGLPTVSLSSGDTVKSTLLQTSGASAHAGFGAAFRPNSINGRNVSIPWAPNSYCVNLASSQTTLKDDDVTAMTITVTQAGWLILADATFNASLTATSNLTGFDVSEACFFTSYFTDAYASTELILSGSGKTAFAPSGFLSGMRKNRLVRFPIVRADSGNTITLKSYHKLGTDVLGQFNVPFVPLSQQLQPPCPPPSC